jgi:8-oxo-(d)GTP phosphatase
VGEPHVVAAGGVLWRRSGAGVEVAVVHRPKYDDWSLPKGKLDPGELPLAGALRELREETGFCGTAGRTLGTTSYRVLQGGRDVPKTVHWWSVAAGDGRFEPSHEVDRLIWLTGEAAMRALTLGRDTEPLRRFLDLPPDLPTLLLVRHGSAGSRDEWDGDDDARPLDERGRAQAAAVAAVLPLYGPRRVLSAPPLRCTQTVAPLAERLDVPVEQHDVLGEQVGSRDPEAVLRLLLGLAAEPGATVACSQGGVIPDAVVALHERSGLPLPHHLEPPRKGSVWALTFCDGALVDADHLPSLTG